MNIMLNDLLSWYYVATREQNWCENKVLLETVNEITLKYVYVLVIIKLMYFEIDQSTTYLLLST